MNRKTNLGRTRAGFTLVELLVASAITAALGLAIAIVVRNVGGVWTRSAGRVGADAQARIVLDRLQQDLQGALFRDDGNVWMAVDVLDRTTNSGLWDNTGANLTRIKPSGPVSLQMTAPNLADARFGQTGVWLRFFTTGRPTLDAARRVQSPSAPVAVAYQIIRRPTATNAANASAPRTYLLHRAEVRSHADANGRPGVLESGYDITAPAYTRTSNSTNNGGTTGDPRAITTPGSNTSAPRNLDSVIADNVIDFGVRCYVYDRSAPGGLRLVFPAASERGELSGARDATLRSRLPAGTPATATNYNFVFPDVVDVMLRVLTDEGAAQISNIEKNQTPAPLAPLKYNNNDQQWWWGVATENSRVYTRRIVINGRSS